MFTNLKISREYSWLATWAKLLTTNKFVIGSQRVYPPEVPHIAISRLMWLLDMRLINYLTNISSISLRFFPVREHF